MELCSISGPLSSDLAAVGMLYNPGSSTIKIWLNIHIHVHDNSTTEMLRKKGEAMYTTQQKGKATQHNSPKAVIFQRKNELPRVGFEPTTLRILATLLPTELPRQLSWLGRITYTNQGKASKASQPDKQVNSNLA